MGIGGQSKQHILNLAATYRDPRQLAAALHKMCDKKAPFPVCDLAEVLGFRVYVQRFLFSKMYGYLRCSNKRGKINRVIAVSAKTSYEHQLFTVAHELWRYFCECLKGRTESIDDDIISWYDPKSGDDAVEHDAFVFASCLLMPEREFRWVYAKCKPVESMSITETVLCDYFHVTLDAVRHRIRDLKIGVA